MLQLLGPVGPVHIWDSSKAMPVLSSPRSGQRQDGAASGTWIPPELFKNIYGWWDGKLARTCRLVCRYWDSQCRDRAFAEISLGYSEGRMLDVVRQFKLSPAWRHIPPLVNAIERVPEYNNRSRVPWLHLLDPRWGDGARLTIVGPFPGHQSLRSIHFCLPRSPPPAFSPRFTRLVLKQVSFRRFEDSACLLSGLPNLEELSLVNAIWQSLPAELPRRRPRVHRNKLRSISFENCKVAGLVLPSFAFAAFTFFLSIYPPSSLLSADAITVFALVLRAVNTTPDEFRIRLNRDTDGCANGFGKFLCH